MISMGIINWEIKAAFIFAIMALLISLLTGFAAGNDFSVILLRAFLLCVVFGFIGFGSIFALKKYVPEIYDIFSMQLQQTPGGSAQAEIDVQGVEPSIEMTDSVAASREMPDDVPETPEPVYDEPPQMKRDFPDSAPVSEKSMGRHKLEEKAMKYSPKLMAEAVRTMMSKDKD
jgi:hypothetical protein